VLICRPARVQIAHAPAGFVVAAGRDRNVSPPRLNSYIVRRRTLQMTERQKLGVAAWIGIGILLGTLAGAAADNVGGGFTVGAVLGLAFGYAYYRKVRA
jgi:hypothetical protein